MLDDAKVGERIPNTVNIPGSKDKTSETIYDELPDSPKGGKGKGKGKGKGGQGGPGYMDGDGLGDDILQEGQPLTDAEVKQLQGQMKVELAEAAQCAKMRGKMPGSLQKIVDSILESTV